MIYTKNSNDAYPNNSIRTKNKYRLASNGAQSVPMGIPICYLNILLPTMINMLSIKYSNISINVYLSVLMSEPVSNDQCADPCLLTSKYLAPLTFEGLLNKHM